MEHVPGRDGIPAGSDPEAGLDVLSASPEAFLIRHGGRIESRPIKGMATTMSAMLAKDYAENVMIADLETEPRGPYCGAIGWVDADTGEAALAVGIRTFWADRDATGQRWPSTAAR
jgi:anthranilate/para-aminobenzoate synthase component I